MKEMHNQRGQALVETGIVLVIFILLVGGIMQFGHAFMVANAITHAARDGARLAASWQTRGTCGQIPTASRDQISNQVHGMIASLSPQALTVTVTQVPAIADSATPPCPAAGATPTVKVNVNGCVPYIFNILGFSSGGCSGGFLMNRDVTFDDELRAAFGSP